VLGLHIRADPGVTDAVSGVNRKDRHLAAVAVAAKVDVVVSNDRRLRRQLAGLVPPVPAPGADQFALRLLHQDRDTMNEVLVAMVAKRHRRPVTRDELVDQLQGAFPRFAAALRHG
jgi:hypothetical protein